MPDSVIRLVAAAIAAIIVVGAFVSAIAHFLVSEGWQRDRPDWVLRGERLGSLFGREMFGSVSLGKALVSARPQAVERLLLGLTNATGALAVNARINALIWLGRYREAVRLYFRHRRTLEPAPLRLLAQVNVAEALYNRGRWNLARQLIDALRDEAKRLATENRWIGTGLVAQRAWIAAHCEELELGRALMKDATERDFPDDYVAELHFTRAALELAAKDAGAAEKHLRDARRALRRKSSERNLLFLEARLAVLKGEKDRAIDLCRQASEHPYRGQGGDGLLLWGDLLAERGDVDGARAAWRLAIERDPESESARLATQRLG